MRLQKCRHKKCDMSPGAALLLVAVLLVVCMSLSYRKHSTVIPPALREKTSDIYDYVANRFSYGGGGGGGSDQKVSYDAKRGQDNGGYVYSTSTHKV